MIWFTLILMAAVTFMNRYAFLASSIRFTPSPKVQVFLSYSAYAVLTAIWAPIVFSLEQGRFEIAGWDYVLGVSLAALLTMLRVPSLWVVLLSIGGFALLRPLVG